MFEEKKNHLYRVTNFYNFLFSFELVEIQPNIVCNRRFGILHPNDSMQKPNYILRLFQIIKLQTQQNKKKASRTKIKTQK